MANEKWSQQEEITTIDSTTLLCSISGIDPNNNLVKPENLGLAPIRNPRFIGSIQLNTGTTITNEYDNTIVSVDSFQTTTFGHIGSTTNIVGLVNITGATLVGVTDATNATIALGTSGNLTANGKTISATQVSYLSGVTSNIQTQLNGKQPTEPGKGLSAENFTSIYKGYVEEIPFKQDILLPINKDTQNYASAVISRLALTGVITDSNFGTTDLSGLDLTGSKFIRCNFTDANLSLTSFASASLLECIFKDANLNSSWLYGADVHHSTFFTANGLSSAIGDGLLHVKKYDGLTVIWLDGFAYSYSTSTNTWTVGTYYGSGTFDNIPVSSSSDTSETF